MSLSNTRLKRAVSDVKVALAFLSKSEMKEVLTEVDAQLFNGKSPSIYSKRTVTKLQRDSELLKFIISLPLENYTQSFCLQKCIEAFGEERAPTRSALSRHWAWLKEQRRERYGKQ